MTSLIVRVCSKSPISAVELIYVEEELPTYGLVIPMSALVISRHFYISDPCPLYPQHRTT